MPLLGAVVLAVGCHSVPQQSASTPSGARGVVVVVVDALRADHLGAYGYTRPTSPRIDQFAADATFFRNAITTAPWTLPAMGSLWTSLYPSVHGATQRSSEIKFMTDPQHFRPVSVLNPTRATLAEVLRSNGYKTVAFVDGVYSGSVFGLNKGFDLFVEDECQGARMNVEGLFQWLDEHQTGPFFAYLHLIEVHSPYMPPAVPGDMAGRSDAGAQRMRKILAEEQQRYPQFDFDPTYKGPVDGSLKSIAMIRGADPAPAPRDLEHLIALYDRGIAYTDYWIGQLIDGLKQRGLYDQVTLVVTADHGEEFLEHGALEHGIHFYEELLRVPLIVRLPKNGHGRVVEQQVGVIDLMPTILDTQGVNVPDGLHGISLRPLFDGGAIPDDRFLFGEADQGPDQKAMRSNILKYIRGGRRQELYDLRVDRAEKENLCADKTSDCGEFADLLGQWENSMKAASGRAPTPQAATIDEKTRERLRALGYDQ